MPKYSFKPKNTKEFISSVNASSLSEAKQIFAKIKVLSLENFNKLYEVIER